MKNVRVKQIGASLPFRFWLIANYFDAEITQINMRIEQ